MKFRDTKLVSSSWESLLWNSEISAALWVHIAAFEVTLRTFLDSVLSSLYRSNSWWECQNLLSEGELADLRRIQKRITSRKLDQDRQFLIDNLSLSFWIKLLGKRYHETIWLKIIKYMPVYPGRREDFYNKAREIRNLRNSIAHHGPIMRRNLIRDHAYLGELTAILDPELACEVEKRSRVLDLLLNARLVGSGGGI